jgi:putative ATP-dependent endonuclease of OLD family
MKLRELVVKNFRNLVDVRIPVEDTTVLVGENNAGKTALLDALRVALPRTAFGRTNPFEEYDYHMSKPDESPQTSQGITVELWFREDAPDEWPVPIIQALTEIVQTDPIRDLDSIGIRLTSHFDAATKQLVTTREFLNLKGEPLTGKSQGPYVATRFLEYVRFFCLSALRDCDAEFSSRSQFWGKILRDLKIDDAKRKELSDELKGLNKALLEADPRLEQVRKSLETIQKVAVAGGNASINALPLQPWDLIARAQVVIRARGTEMDFPLSKHGQGVQSLAVVFLFKAFVEVLLKPTFNPETEALLALEEPEAHLHPHAIRALTRTLGEINTQKIISTHSPFVLQGVPITSLRLFRRNGASARVLYIRRQFTAHLPRQQGVITFSAANRGKYEYHETTETLLVSGSMEEKEYRTLATAYAADPDALKALKALEKESQLYMTREDIQELDRYAQRIRGEIFFARAWLLCEGPSDFAIIHYFAELLGTPLDEACVTVIDFQNNGTIGAFVSLAQNLDIPWIMVSDADGAGQGYVKAAGAKCSTPAEAADRARPLPELDLELFLVKNGFAVEYHGILTAQGVALTKKPDDSGSHEEIAGYARSRKTECATALIHALRSSGAGASRVPKFFADAIRDIIAKAA